MNTFQSCKNTADLVPLYLPQQLYLKPSATISISIKLPQKFIGKTVTNYELKQKIRALILPDEFSELAITKMTVDIIKLDAEVELRSLLFRVLAKLDKKTIKLKDFPELLHLNAMEKKTSFPSRHDWDSFFRDAKDMDENKPGERPDTVYIANLPVKWFLPKHITNSKNNSIDDLLPSEKIFFCVFEKFGAIRNVDIPMCDPYRLKMKSHLTGIHIHSDDKDNFEGYIQFKDYMSFMQCMNALRGMKLVQKEDSEAFMVNIHVDFDKSKHLTQASIQRREIVRDRLIFKTKQKEQKEKEEQEKQKEKEESKKDKDDKIKSDKEKRRQEREKKRKEKYLAKFKANKPDDLSQKIAEEEKKLLHVVRRLQAIRIVEALFKRIQQKDNIPMTSGSQIQKLADEAETSVRLQHDKLQDVIDGRQLFKSIVSHQIKGNEGDNDPDPCVQSADVSTSNQLYAQRMKEWLQYLPNAITQAYTPYYMHRLYNPGFFNRRQHRRGGMHQWDNRKYNKHQQNKRYHSSDKRSYWKRRDYTRSPSSERSDDRRSRHRSRSISHYPTRSHRRRSRSRSRSSSARSSRSRSRARQSSHRSRTRSRRSRTVSKSRERSRSRKSSRSRSRSRSRTSHKKNKH